MPTNSSSAGADKQHRARARVRVAPSRVSAALMRGLRRAQTHVLRRARSSATASPSAGMRPAVVLADHQIAGPLRSRTCEQPVLPWKMRGRRSVRRRGPGSPKAIRSGRTRHRHRRRRARPAPARARQPATELAGRRPVDASRQVSWSCRESCATNAEAGRSIGLLRPCRSARPARCS